MEPTREEAWSLLNEYTANPNLVKHALAVEAAMVEYAARFGEDPVRWGLVGLIHDFDYDRYPEEHPYRGVSILRQLDWPADMIHAIEAHAEYTGVPRTSLLDRTLFAIDELCGFVTAAVLVRPDRKLSGLPVQSIRKRMKDKAFARAVSREDIRRGAEELGVDLDEHIGLVIQAMSRVADRLGLAGS